MIDKLIELAERCEKAEGPDRELDADIAQAFGHKVSPQTANYTMEMFYAIEWQKPHPYAGMKEPCPAWTASLDAALTLVPPWSWRVGNLASGRAFADLGTQKSLQCIEGATPALALCAAAIRASAERE